MDKQNNGCIWVRKGITKWMWWKDKNAFSLYLTCAFLANREDQTIGGVVVKEGSFVTSVEQLAKEANMKLADLDDALLILVITRDIIVMRLGEGMVVTITDLGKWISLRRPGKEV